MNTKALVIKALLFCIACFFLSCKAQENSSTKSAVPKVVNHLKGELDYTKGTLELIQMQANGKDISLGKINTDGTIHFKLPEFNIKALYDSIPLQHYNFHSWFSIGSSCKDRDVFAKTPFTDVYSQKTNAIYIKKYGTKVAVLEAVSDKKKIHNHNATQDSLAVLNTYYWFYIDRAITYKDKCTKISHRSNKAYATINTDISFKKGWNFIEEKTIWDLNYDKNDPNSIQLKKTYFTKSKPTSNKVKWSLRQVINDTEIQTAKRLHNLTPITKEQFIKWVPNKLDDLSVTTKEYGNPPEGQKNKNNIHLIYANKIQKKEIDLYVVDCAKNPDDMEMVDFAYAMSNDGKDAKDIKPYVAQYKESENFTKLLYKIEDRIIVNATGANMNPEELWNYIKKLNVKKLIKN